MNHDLLHNTWMRCGTSLLWDAQALNQVCSPEAVRSLREFLRLHQTGWPEGTLKLIQNRTFVVAGLETAMDTLHPDEAVEWLEKTVYPVVLDFQEIVAGGGGGAALIFWLADRTRVFHKASENTYHWHCTGEHRQQSIPLGRCIWNGAESDVRRIIAPDTQKTTHHIGLFLQRIS
ncbi:MAG: 5'-nucleotidase [Pedosphaera sp.]|nr:5'-nucleotidase [Pedosphaera sp.]